MEILDWQFERRCFVALYHKDFECCRYLLFLVEIILNDAAVIVAGIASEAKQSRTKLDARDFRRDCRDWIASSLTLLAMTERGHCAKQIQL
jgi:hypothetical protein